jgi:hypothetical protein
MPSRDKHTDADISQSLLWRRLDRPGHESGRLFSQNSCWHLTGTAVFVHEQQPCRLDYLIICDSTWQTLSGKVAGWVGSAIVESNLAVDSHRRWSLNGVECPQVENCFDLDLNFSPSTNLLPIRRLNLAIGKEARVKAAWLRFPSFVLEPLEQIYRRLDQTIYRYESAGGRFVTELEVNAVGLVTRYPNFWEAEAGF